MVEYKSKSYFSLIEIMLVLAIMMLVSGIVISQFGRLPTAAKLQNCTAQIKTLFATAEFRAVTSGNRQQIIYSSEQRTFSIKDDKTALETQRKKNIFTLPDGIVADFQKINTSNNAVQFNENNSQPEFTCFPDGLIAGPDIKLQLRKHKLKLHFSPLTGTITIIKPDTDMDENF